MKFAPTIRHALRLGLLLLVTCFFLTTNTAHAKTPRTQRIINPFAPFAALRAITQQPEIDPNATRGLDLYTQRCANCHGPDGNGDGELASQLPNTPTSFRSPDFRQMAVPLDLFDTITNGRPAQGMPPFGPAVSNPIDDAGRWDLVAAIYSLATPPEAIATGQAIYEANCLACHGATGAGDGPEAAAQEAPPATISGLDYWGERSNTIVFERLAPDMIPQHTYSLSDEERQAVVDYARTFSYAYTDPALLTAPIPTATIRGQIVNGTTSAPLTSGEVLLRAFTRDLTETLNLTTTLDSNGRYTFDLTDISPNWIFLATLLYNNTSFSSGANQLDRAQPILELPIIVYEPTTDDSGITIEQLHLILEFVEDRLLVNELYRFSNANTAVYVGPTGDPEAGTVELILPAGAQNITFQRSLGGFESFIPAQEVRQTETGWADVVPVQPGRGSLNLLVQYELPFPPGQLTLAHPLLYNVTAASAMLPDTGVTISNNEWVTQGIQQTDNGPYIAYIGPGLPAGTALNVSLAGRPSQVLDANGRLVLVRNNTAELLVGGLALLAVVIGMMVVVRAWQRPLVTPASSVAADIATNVATDPAEINRLLQAAADLDEAYGRGDLDPDHYQQERVAIKEQLLTLWPREE